ncbi:MAG TPA: hypothetical protein VG326_01435 [Tepidisphaeraceae bacterium]|nr:hypothetical protein [Tepidisphaeraceae bacterium]
MRFFYYFASWMIGAAFVGMSIVLLGGCANGNARTIINEAPAVQAHTSR